jgi:hypothetical protein
LIFSLFATPAIDCRQAAPAANIYFSPLSYGGVEASVLSEQKMVSMPAFRYIFSFLQFFIGHYWILRHWPPALSLSPLVNGLQ